MSARLPQFSLRSMASWRALKIVLVLLLACSGMAPAVSAQVATFDNGEVTVGGSLNFPLGMATDAQGNLYIATVGGGTIVKVPASDPTCATPGDCITLATPGNEPVGVAVDKNGNVYYTEYDIGKVVEIPWNGSSYGTQTVLTTTAPYGTAGLALDANGDLFIGQDSARLEELPWNGTQFGALTPVGPAVGTSVNGERVSGSFGVATDSSGNLYIADQDAGIIKVAAGDLTCANASDCTLVATGIGNPYGVSVDLQGNVYSTDLNAGGVYETLWTGSAYAAPIKIAQFTQPYGIWAQPGGGVFVADSVTNRVTELEPQAVNFGTEEIGSTSAAVTLNFSFKQAVTLNSSTPYQVLTQGAAGLDFAVTSSTCSGSESAGAGCSVVAIFKPVYPGPRHGVVELVDSSGNVIATAYVYGVGKGPQVAFNPPSGAQIAAGLNQPRDIAVDGNGNVFVVNSAVTGSGAVEEVTGGTPTPVGGTAFKQPQGIAIDGAGNLYIADTGDGVVKEILAAGGYTTVNPLGSGFTQPVGVTVDGSGNVFVADEGTAVGAGNGHVFEILASSGYTTVATIGSGFNSPAGVALDGNGNLFVADAAGGLYEVEAVAGVLPASPTVQPLDSGHVVTPDSVAVDAAGNLYVDDPGANIVFQLTQASGYTAQSAFGPATGPVGLALDGSGNLYAASAQSGSLAKIELSTPGPLNFPTATNVGSTDTVDGPQSTLVENIGNDILNFPVPGSGSNPSVSAEFALDGGTTCPQVSSSGSAATLAAGASCTYAVNFTPTIGGSISGSVNLTDNSLNTAAPTYAMQSISLNGTGQSADVTAMQGLAAAPNPALAGQSVALTVSVVDTTNSGTHPAGTVAFTDIVGTNTTSYTANVVNGVATYNYVPVVGVHTITASFTPTDSTLFQPSSITSGIALAVNQGTPVIAWSPAAQINYGTNLSGVLNPSASYNSQTVQGSYTYTAQMAGGAAVPVTATTVLTAGSYTLTATFTPTDTTDYKTATKSVPLAVDQGTPVIAWSPAAQIMYGTTLAGELNPSASYNSQAVQGSYTYTAQIAGGAAVPVTASTVLGAGSYTLTATFTPTDTTDYKTATKSAPLTVEQGTPVIAWSPAAQIMYGTTLAGELNPSASYNSQAVQGSYTYTAQIAGGAAVSVTASTVLGAGSYTLTATFTPTDTTNYKGANKSVPLVVEQVIPAIAWTPTTQINYGTTLAAVLNPSASYNSQTVQGSYTYTAQMGGGAAVPVTASTVLAAGSYTLTATFTPTDATDYKGATKSAPLTVEQDTPVIAWAPAAQIMYGTMLAGELNPSASYNSQTVQGSYTYTAQMAGGAAVPVTASTVLAAGSYTLTATFTPTDATDYKGTTKSAPLTVEQGAPVIAWSPAAQINYGTTLAGILNPVASYNSQTVQGIYTYTAQMGGGAAVPVTASTVLAAGSYTLTATFTPTDTTDYKGADKSVPLVVEQGTTTIAWSPAAQIVYGASLAGELNPAATYNSQTVQGSFTYTAQMAGGPAVPVTAATVLPVGNYAIMATFTPTDTTDYKGATKSVGLTVAKATLNVVANNATRVYGTANPAFTGTYSGETNGNTFVETYTTTATSSSPAGTYAIVPSVSGADLSDYTVQVQNGTLTVTKAASAVSLASSNSNANLNASIVFTATVTSTTTGTPTQSVEFLDGSTVLGSSQLNVQGVATFTISTLSAGVHHISAVYSGDVNFNTSVSAQYMQTVTAPDYSLTMTPPSLSLKPGQTGKINIGFDPVGGFSGTVTFTCAGLPAEAACSFAPASLVADGSNTPQSSVLTITTLGPNHGTASQVASRRSGGSGSGMLRASVFFLPGLLFGGFLMAERKKLNGGLKCLLLLFLLASTMSGMIGCGFSVPAAPVGSKTVTVTATVAPGGVGGETHTSSFTLTITQ